MSRRELAAAGVVALACTVFVTWPQAAHVATHVAAHDDSMFSMWRLGWVAHALRTDPSSLFDGNTFYPAKNTLAFSDATLLQGLVAAPLLWAGIPLVAVYNALLFVGFAGSGLAMFVLARGLAGAFVPALVAAALFTLAPYRIEHFMHLELQWTMWMPLALWAAHRAVVDGSARHGVLCGLFLWLQIVSCVYYGVFLAIAIAVFVPVLLALNPGRGGAPLKGLSVGAALAIVLSLPYAWPYAKVSRSFGQRPADEIATYSAGLLDYAVGPPTSWLWSWTSDAGGAEHRLSLGLVAVALAVAALGHRPKRVVAAYLVLAAMSVELSRGMNGMIYPRLLDFLPALQGLRSPARFGILAACAVAVLAALGAGVVLRRASTPGARRLVAVAIFALLLLDSAQTGMLLTPAAQQAAASHSVYKAVRTLGAAPVMELPMPRLDQLPGREAFYTFWSVGHWHPLVNGYSGYYPPQYVETVVRTEHFPDDRSFAQLRHLGVRYIIVHRDFYPPDQYVALMAAMRLRPELRHYGTFPAPSGAAELFLVQG